MKFVESPAKPLGKRTSRTGPVPSALRIGLKPAGAVVTAVSCAWVGASPICGFPLGKPGVGIPLVLPGLLPPTVGWEWHWKQLTALNEGPRPGKVEPPVWATGPTTALTSNTASAWNQKPVRLLLKLTTLPAPPSPMLSAGCTVSMHGGAVGNFADWIAPAVGGQNGLLVPTGRGPGSVWAWLRLTKIVKNSSARKILTPGRKVILLRNMEFTFLWGSALVSAHVWVRWTVRGN